MPLPRPPDGGLPPSPGYPPPLLSTPRIGGPLSLSLLAENSTKNIPFYPTVKWVTAGSEDMMITIKETEHGRER